MRKVSLIALFVFLTAGLILSGCGKKAPEEGADLQKPAEMKSDRELARDLYSMVKGVGEDYKTWSLWPGHTEFESANSPHGKLFSTYLNDTAVIDLNAGNSQFSDGAVIVKDNYDENKQLASVTVMYKIKGYSAETGDWFWAKFTPDWQPETMGKITACIECHAQNSANDYIMTAKMPAAAEEALEPEHEGTGM